MWKKCWQAIVIGLLIGVIIRLSLLGQDNVSLTHFFTPKPLSFNQAVRRASPAVVNVYSQAFTENHQEKQNSINSLGSGIIMSGDGYILTNKHVIDHAEQITVALQSGKVFTAHLVGSDTLMDLAVLKIQSLDTLPTIQKNTQHPLQVGDVVFAIGNPYNLGQSVSQGIISALGRNAIGDFVGRQDLIQTDTSINRGNSGGALINSLGELIAINTLSIGKNTQDLAEGLNFAIPIKSAENIMRKIIQDGRVIRGYLGAESNILFNNGKGNRNQGVLITAVVSDSPAEKAGLQPNDIVMKFNQQSITSPAELMQLVSDSKPNSHVTLQIQRLKDTLNLNVTLGEWMEEYNLPLKNEK